MRISWTTRRPNQLILKEINPEYSLEGLMLKLPPILWPPDAKGQFTRKHPILGALEILQQCENFFGIILLQFLSHLLSSSMVGLMAMSSKRTYATYLTSQVCCSQSPCPHSRPLLTSASGEETQTLKGRSGSVSRGGHCSFPRSCVHSVLFCPPSFSCRYEV